MVWQSLESIVEKTSNMGVSYLFQFAHCLTIKAFLPFDCIYTGTHFCQNAGLKAGSGSDFKDFLPFLNIEQLTLKGYRVWLRNGLAISDRDRPVLVRQFFKSFVQKEMSGHLVEGG